MSALLAHIRRYPALALSLGSAVLGVLAHYLPGLDSAILGDLVAAALSLAVGVELHRRTTPVPPHLRGLRPSEIEFDEVADTNDSISPTLDR